MNPFKKFWPIIFIFLLHTACGQDEKITAFQNVNLVPMTEEKVTRNQTVLIKGDRIFKIGLSNRIEIPSNARVINGQGAYLMPGLADMHVHLKGEWPLPQLDLYIANGVTTVRDLDGRDFMLQWQKEINAGKRVGPTLYVAAPTIRGHEENPPELVLRRKSGYDCFKLYSYLSQENYQKVMEIAKQHQLYTIGHIPFAVGLDGVMAAGLDEIAHVEELSFELIDFDRTKNLNPEKWLPYIIQKAIKQYQVSSGFHVKNLNNAQRERLSSIINKLKFTNIPVCTTLVVDDVIVQKLFEPDEFLARPENVYLSQKYKQDFLGEKEKHQIQFKGFENVVPFKYRLDKMLLAELHQAGIPIVLGTDAGTGAMGIVPGFSIHEELRILVECGFTPYEAIAASTKNASKVIEAMTGENDFGTIEVGKRADVILVNNNPLEDVSHIKDIRGVMASGEWYERSYIEAIVSPALLSGITIEGNIFQARSSNNSFNTHIEIVVSEKLYSPLPDAIDSITVTLTDPDGTPSRVPLPRYRYLEQFRDFWYRIDGPPALGKYTFKVTGKGLSGTATDFQMVNRAIPLPDITSFLPTAGTILTTKTPTFSWAPVKYPEGEIYYRLVINDLAGKRIYGTGRAQNMLSHTVSKGILKPGQTYQYRVRVMDSEDWVEMQNRSESQWLTFLMSENLE